MMALKPSILFLVLYFTKNGCSGANILAVVPTPSFSHQAAFRPLWRSLSGRGHNVTLITTNPMNEPHLHNLKEIDISYFYEAVQKFKVIDVAMDDSSSILTIFSTLLDFMLSTTKTFLESSDGQNLIHNKDNHFDVVIAEAVSPSLSFFGWRYQAPLIGICSLDCGIQLHDDMGNPIHPILNPDPNLPVTNADRLLFPERMMSFGYSLFYRAIIYLQTYKAYHALVERYFDEKVPSLEEIHNNISMLFIGTSPVFHTLRPLMPNTITIGSGMHLIGAKREALHKEVQDFLDSASSGAIYFSLGSNVKGRHMNLTTKRSIIKVFSTMPYKILWKIEDDFENLPPNVFTSKWFNSQSDILRHSNIKLFITQGGLQSMQESLHANKPMIGIPFFGDQFRNINRMVQLEYGLKIDKYNITEHSIKETVTEIMSNPKYLRNAQKYGNILRDVDMSDVEKAVWWTEYVSRHKGVKHFRNAALDMPFWKRNMLDVYAIATLLIVITFQISLFIFKKFIRLAKMLVL